MLRPTAGRNYRSAFRIKGKQHIRCSAGFLDLGYRSIEGFGEFPHAFLFQSRRDIGRTNAEPIEVVQKAASIRNAMLEGVGENLAVAEQDSNRLLRLVLIVIGPVSGSTYNRSGKLGFFLPALAHSSRCTRAPLACRALPAQGRSVAANTLAHETCPEARYFSLG